MWEIDRQFGAQRAKNEQLQGRNQALEAEVRDGPVTRPLDFPYHPHVTVAHHLDEEAMDRAFEGLADFRCAFDVRAIELYHHDHDGVWKVLRSFPLGEVA